MLGPRKMFGPLAAIATMALALGGSLSVAPTRVRAAEPVYDGGPGSALVGRHRDAALRLGDRGRRRPRDGGWVVVGFTRGALGEASAIGEDAFVRAYAADGSVRWTRQFSTPNGDSAAAVAVGEDGSVAVAGTTGSAVPGQTTAGYDDAFITSFDGDGTLRWTRQFGSEFSDRAAGIAVDGEGNILVVGTIGGTVVGDDPDQMNEDVFVRSYGPDGSLRWSRQVDSDEHSSDAANGVAVGGDGTVDVAGRRGGCS